VDDAKKALEPVSHGDGARRFVTAVAGPTAETGDRPAGPGQAFVRMRVLLLGRASLQLFLQGIEDLNLFEIKYAARGCMLSADRARQHELHGDGGGDERDSGELFESLAILDYALFDAQSLTLKGSKQLLDVPAQAVPADHDDRLRNALDKVRRQQ